VSDSSRVVWDLDLNLNLDLRPVDLDSDLDLDLTHPDLNMIFNTFSILANGKP